MTASQNDKATTFITMRTIVVSAVSIRKGGTLTILRGCLECLSAMSQSHDLRVVALVHRRDLADYPGIEYIEMPHAAGSWTRRLWYEYVSMYRLSRRLAPVSLWLSLHDTTPRVAAERQAVYCQTSFPFLQWQVRDLLFDYKIVVFTLCTRFVYRLNVNRNRWLIVQAEWLRSGLSRMLGQPRCKFVVAPPRLTATETNGMPSNDSGIYIFLVAATPDCHKNFETVCKAAKLLEKEMGKDRFRVVLTIDGTENRYSRWLYRRWGKLDTISFAGLMDRKSLFRLYANVNCLVFPSRIETWGLPISEFAPFGKPMLLADLPYAHEAAAGSQKTAFFNVKKAEDLKDKMMQLLLGNESGFTEVPEQPIAAPVARTWKELIETLLA